MPFPCSRATACSGERFRVLLPATPSGAAAATQVARATAEGCWLFGRWSVEDDCAALYPITLGSHAGIVQLFQEAA